MNSDDLPSAPEEESLSRREKMRLATQSLLEAIPYVGGSLSTAYFGYKQEIRFKRLEQFYAEMAEKIEEEDIVLVDIDEHDKEALFALLEQVNNQVEREVIEEKLECLKNIAVNSLSEPTTIENYDRRRSFLNALQEMTRLDLAVMHECFQEERSRVIDLDVIDTDDEENVFSLFASSSRLESFGFLKVGSVDVVALGDPPEEGEDFDDERLNRFVEISPLGIQFYEFCLQEA
jgi:hypothetical protein